MSGPWAQPFKNRKEVKDTLNTMGLQFHICWFLGAILAIVGLIAAAMNNALGLEPIYWLLLAIAAFLAGIPMLVTWAVSIHLLGIESNKKKEE